MTTRYHLNTDHWSKMRMNVIKNSINLEQRGRVLSWKKHNTEGAKHELEAAIRNERNLPGNQIGTVHNFQDVLTTELDEFVPGNGYFRRRPEQNGKNIYPPKDKIPQDGHPLMTGSQYTLMTLPTDPQGDQTRSRVPVFQCRGKI